MNEQTSNEKSETLESLGMTIIEYRNISKNTKMKGSKKLEAIYGRNRTKEEIEGYLHYWHGNEDYTIEIVRIIK